MTTWLLTYNNVTSNAQTDEIDRLDLYDHLSSPTQE